MFGIGITDVATWLGAGVTIGGIVIAWVRWQLSGAFGSRDDITALAARISNMEAKLANVPTHDDVRQLGQRIGAVEREISVVAADVRGIREGNGRIEHAIRTLYEHELAKARKESA